MWPRRKRRSGSEATQARVRAKEELEATRAKTAHYRALASRLRELREENHFAAAFRKSMGGKP